MPNGGKMKNRQLTLIQNTKKRKLHKTIFWLCFLCILGLGVFCVIAGFSIKKIEVSGNQTYTDGEIIQAVQERDYVGNTLIMMAQNRIFGQKYLPFIEEITMSFSDTHTLQIHIKEKLRSGVFQYMNKNVYFDSEGIAQESRDYLFSGVPVVTGIKFNKMVLAKEIPVDGDYFDTILAITEKISTYGLDISEIHFESENDITLKSGKFEIYLGTSAFLDGKMSKITEVLEAVPKKHKKGTIDMHLYTDEKNIITFHK